MNNIQVFGQDELEEYLKNGGKVYSHLISIGNPKRLFGKNPGQNMPTIFKKYFKEILRLEFFDVDKLDHLRKNDRPAIIPEIDDIKKVIKFYNRTKSTATGYTIHCWRGVSRSAAVALGILYLETNSEEKSRMLLQKIRPQACPLIRIVKFFDELLGSNLEEESRDIRFDFFTRMKKELDYDEDNYLEELPKFEE